MKSLKILLVDDEPETGAALQSWLARCGYDARYVSGPAAADRAITENAFDVILSDIQMPGNGRLEWIERVLHQSCPAPVLLMTGDPQLETAMRAANLPVSAYLLKPLDYAHTAMLIEEVARQHRARREALAALAAFNSVRQQETSTSLDVLAPRLESLARDLSRTIRTTSRSSDPAATQPWRDAIVETIAVLEKTKHSFRSRELGELRRRLEQLLAVMKSPPAVLATAGA